MATHTLLAVLLLVPGIAGGLVLHVRPTLHPPAASGQVGVCLAAMAAACPHEQGGDGKRMAVRVMKCDACAGRHQETLRAAGCGATEVQSWCSAVSAQPL